MLVRNHGPSLVVNTPAKLNLFLEVLGRRPDGYHELETVMVSIGLYDTLTFVGSDLQQTRLQCRCCVTSSALPTGEENLVLRAVQILREATGCETGVSIDLWKRIPLKAGLGGGSSDAAATLVGLNRLWNLGLPSAELHRLAASLGSDVNFFLDSPLAAVCSGRGERVAPLSVPRQMHFVIVCPETGLSTGEVFQQWSAGRQETKSMTGIVEALASNGIETDPAVLHNALEAPAQSLNPDISRVLRLMSCCGTTPVLMSGSGSACFAVCRTARHAQRQAGRLRNLRLGRVFHVALRA
jgi:4-diphosphocytidyl-2-C-methyl-D-erythritol kinase